MMRRVDIPAPMGMRMQAAEAEQPHVVALGHFLERRFHRIMVAGELGGLGPATAMPKARRGKCLCASAAALMASIASPEPTAMMPRERAA